MVGSGGNRRQSSPMVDIETSIGKKQKSTCYAKEKRLI